MIAKTVGQQNNLSDFALRRQLNPSMASLMAHNCLAARLASPFTHSDVRVSRLLSAGP